MTWLCTHEPFPSFFLFMEPQHLESRQLLSHCSLQPSFLSSRLDNPTPTCDWISREHVTRFWPIAARHLLWAVLEGFSCCSKQTVTQEKIASSSAIVIVTCDALNCGGDSSSWGEAGSVHRCFCHQWTMSDPTHDLCHLRSCHMRPWAVYCGSQQTWEASHRYKKLGSCRGWWRRVAGNVSTLFCSSLWLKSNTQM